MYVPDITHLHVCHVPQTPRTHRATGGLCPTYYKVYLTYYKEPPCWIPGSGITSRMGRGCPERGTTTVQLWDTNGGRSNVEWRPVRRGPSLGALEDTQIGVLVEETARPVDQKPAVC